VDDALNMATDEPNRRPPASKPVASFAQKHLSSPVRNAAGLDKDISVSIDLWRMASLNEHTDREALPRQG